MNAILASPTPRPERLTPIPTNKHETACIGHPSFTSTLYPQVNPKSISW